MMERLRIAYKISAIVPMMLIVAFLYFSGHDGPGSWKAEATLVLGGLFSGIIAVSVVVNEGYKKYIYKYNRNNNRKFNILYVIYGLSALLYVFFFISTSVLLNELITVIVGCTYIAYYISSLASEFVHKVR